MSGWWLLVLAGLGLTVLYVGGCWVLPFGFCWWCKGSSRRESRSLILRRRVFRDCWWCGGSGRRLRVGRRVWNYFYKIFKDAS